LGDVFSIRIAGNFVNQDILGSMEFGCNVAGSKLIVVLGHTKCGALKGGLDAAQIEGLGMDNLNHLINHFDPIIKDVIEEGEERSSKNSSLLERLNHQNVRSAIEDIRKQSSTLKNLEKEGKIKIVGANYDVETGAVTWL
jgi:carbonic anhydrase